MLVHQYIVYSFSRYASKSSVQFSKFSSLALILAIVVALFQGCASVYTFPNIARQGDTVAVMVGGSEIVRKDTIDATLTDSDGVAWDLRALGLVRSVFNLRPEGRAHGLHYADFISKNNAWNKGHEPIQTVLIFDVPVGAQLGAATLSVGLNASDDSSGVMQPFSIAMQIVDVPGQPGASDSFLRQNFDTSTPPVNFEDLEPAPHAKISFFTGGPGGNATPGDVLGAAELVVEFDEGIVNGDDLNVYVAESTQRGTLFSTGPFGEHQRMVYFKHDGSQLFITIVAPSGINDKYLQVYVMHPRGLAGDPGLSLLSTTGYDVNGSEITTMPQFTYHP